MKSIKLNFVIALLFLMSSTLYAQEWDKGGKSKNQITFIYPIGSNGFGALRYANDFSLNFLIGLNGGVNGCEVGSFLNFNRGDVKGVQLSGVLNVSTKKSSGVILSGVSNICLDSTAGVHMSGTVNYSKKNAQGIQMAPANIAGEDMKGVQVGVLNYAKKIKGVQLGLVNLLGDTTKGLPIGLVSIVKKGLYELEATAGEVLYANLNYKMGVERFYTVYKIGYSFYKNNPVYSLGLGFGSNIALTERQKVSLDLTTNQIFYNNNWESNLNMLNKVDLSYKYSISDKFSLLIGPSFNLYVTEEKVGDSYGTLNIPYVMHTNEWSNGKLMMWVGLNAGLAVKL